MPILYITFKLETRIYSHIFKADGDNADAGAEDNGDDNDQNDRENNDDDGDDEDGGDGDDSGDDSYDPNGIHDLSDDFSLSDDGLMDGFEIFFREYHW